MSERWRIKKGDLVVVVSGKDKSKKGKILSVNRQTRKVTVEGINIVKKHIKPSMQTPGDICLQERPIHACKVMLWDATIGCPVRVGMRFEGNEKIRVSRKTGQPI